MIPSAKYVIAATLQGVKDPDEFHLREAVRVIQALREKGYVLVRDVGGECPASVANA